MTQHEEFEGLKQMIKEGYGAYVSAVEQLSFDDIKDLRKRIRLLDFYNKATASNTNFRRFIADLNKPFF